MKTLKLFLLLACIAAFAGSAKASLTNVALNADISIEGSYNGNSAALSTVVDGEFRPRSINWQNGTVYWNGTSTYITIDFDNTYKIESFVVQADDNDAYIIEYWDGDSWELAWNVPNYDSYGSGMQTRPNPADDTQVYTLDNPIVTNSIRFKANPASGDNCYSVSEIQAYGSIAVPAPGAVLLGTFGCGIARRFRRDRSIQ